MINRMTGTVLEINDTGLILDVHGIGFAIQMPNNAYGIKNESISLHIHMHWNQEQGPSLFGFTQELEKTVFLMIISCSGLGPKIALAIIAHFGAANFLHTIQSGNEKALSEVSGIGPKKAEQIIVQLRHKVSRLIDSGAAIVAEDSSIQHLSTVTQVLSSLNYTQAEIARAMRHLSETQQNNNLPVDHMIRSALSYLTKKTTLQS